MKPGLRANIISSIELERAPLYIPVTHRVTHREAHIVVLKLEHPSERRVFELTIKVLLAAAVGLEPTTQ
jgi:hypothetical protein